MRWGTRSSTTTNLLCAGSGEEVEKLQVLPQVVAGQRRVKGCAERHGQRDRTCTPAPARKAAGRPTAEPPASSTVPCYMLL